MSDTTKALRDFDLLPDSAHVRLPVAAAWRGVSTPTVWRMSKDGRLPAPIKCGGVTSWRVGDLRKALAKAAV
ncbi:MAG: transcriptional regulator [Comamonadaceae bacterium]|nr:transcriptional regulator [Comamonadaceae bacterium]